GSLELALLVFETADARALAVNTIHRSGRAVHGKSNGAGARNTGGCAGCTRAHDTADVAHDPQSTFHAMTLAWLECQEGNNAVLVQIHGFADRPVGPDLVLSAGVNPAPAPVLRLARSLQGALPGAGIAVWPASAGALGGTTNVQGLAARAHRTVFLHVELGRRIRDRLKTRETSTRVFIQVLGRFLANQGRALD
ncbi:MAG: hypothetical protein V2A73_14395, partial [Pseudomonadota bacterium]